jgi:hypothetical protein
MQVKFLLTSVLALSAITSCGIKKDDSNFEPRFTTPTLAETPILLDKYDTSCIRTFDISDNPIFSIQQFIAGTTQNNFYSFMGQLRNNYVETSNTNAPISKTTYGSKSNITVTIGYNSSTGGYTDRLSISDYSASHGEKLFVCPSATYPGDSVEGVGLNISYNISKTYKAVKAAAPTIKLEPIQVHVVPEHKQLYRLKGGDRNLEQIYFYQTDNAYYDPSAKAISFLPHSEEYQRSAGTTSFWEIPMVAAHEYGHHIFSTLISNKISSKHTFSKGCFKNDVTSMEVNKAQAGSDRDNKVDFALGAMNEGFADLISFYSLDNDERKLTKVNCFEKMREVGNINFGDRHTKLFTQDAFETMNSKEVISKSANKCSIPDYQEIHDVGALFAYGVNQLLSKATNSKKVKLKVLLKWAMILKNEHGNLKHLKAANYIFANMELIYSLALKENAIIPSSNHCSEMNTLFTGSHNISCKYLK